MKAEPKTTADSPAEAKPEPPLAVVRADASRERSNLLAVIERAASDSGVDVTKMERLLALHERIVAREAELEFNDAMAAAQAEMPKVGRDAKNTQTGSLYARLETLNVAAVPIYTKHGFSLSFGTADCPVPEHFRITCVVSHKRGHSRTYQCDLPLDVAGPKGLPNKSKMHGAGSTFSYGRRYLTLLIFNITLVNEDDDGNLGAETKPQGPSSMSPATPAAKPLTTELWELLKDARGTERNWNACNRYLVDLGLLAENESIPNLPPERLREIIKEIKERQ